MGDKFKLSDIKVLTVGLVKRGANRKEFFLLKSADPTEEEFDQLQEEVGMTTDNATEGSEILERLDEVMKDDPTRMEKFIAFIAGLGKAGDNLDAPDGDDEPRDEQTHAAVELPDEVQKKLEQLDVLQKAQDSLKARVRKAEQEAEKERREREHQEYLLKAREYKSISVNEAELADFMQFVANAQVAVEKSAEDEATDQVAWFEALLKSVDAQLAEAGLYREFGTTETPEEKTLLNKAKELVTKGEFETLKDALLNLDAREAREYIAKRQSAAK